MHFTARIARKLRRQKHHPIALCGLSAVVTRLKPSRAFSSSWCSTCLRVFRQSAAIILDSFGVYDFSRIEFPPVLCVRTERLPVGLEM